MQDAARPPARHRLATPLSWLALAVLVGLGAAALDRERVGAALAGARLDGLLLAVLVQTALLPLDAWVQRALLAAQGLPLPVATVLRVELATQPVQLALPARAGLLSKPAWLVRAAGLPAAAALRFLLAYKLISAAGTAWWASLALLLADPAAAPLAAPLALALLLAVPLGLAVGLAATGRSTLPRSARAVAPMWVVQLGQLGAAWLCFRAVGLAVGPADFTWRYALAALAGSLPGPPGGLGTRELVAAGTLGGSLGAEEVVAASLLATGAVKLWPALLGLPLVPRLLREVAVRGQARA